MNYAAQEQYFRGTRRWKGVLLPVFCAAAFLLVRLCPSRLLIVALYGLILGATWVSLAYTPDYLHLTVYPEKCRRWASRVRWPIIASALIVGATFCSSLREAGILLCCVAWLEGCNLLARRLVSDWHRAWFFCGSDFVLVGALLLSGYLGPLMVAALLAVAAHLSVVLNKKHAVRFASFVVLLGLALLVLTGRLHATPVSSWALAGPLFVSALGTALLVRRAVQQNERTVALEMDHLVEFTGYTAGHIRQLMAMSDAKLAANWEAAGIGRDDAPRMAQWYQENSELYLFALAGFNLNYKRIRYCMRMLQLAAGSCLDYGAGNGELLIELARRGHPATYYDVDGLTMKYARFRAAVEGLNIHFFSEKEELAASARGRGFDTIFSLDVLEHLPDLRIELTFLASLLSMTGTLIFNLPGETTKHPMHLIHDLDVRSFLREQGLKPRDVPGMSKREMYLFTRS